MGFAMVVFWELLVGLLLGLAGPAARAQAPAWQGLTAAGSVPYAVEGAIIQDQAVDADGNLYLVGNFHGSVLFGHIALQSTTYNDGYVAKWNPATNRFLWALHVSPGHRGNITSLGVRGTTIYLVGAFSGDSPTFGSIVVPSIKVLNWARTVYLAKLTQTMGVPTFAWALPLCNSSDGTVKQLAIVDSTLYTVGYYRARTIQLGTTTFPNYSASGGHHTVYRQCDSYVVKIQDEGAQGRLVWAQHLGGSGRDELTHIVAEGNRVLVAGTTDSHDLHIGLSPLHYASETGADSLPAFGGLLLARLTDQGATATWQWAQLAGGSGYQAPTALAMQGPAVYVAAMTHAGYQAFGAPLPTNPPLSATKCNLVLTKLLDTGHQARGGWATLAASPYCLTATTLAIRSQQVIVAGLATTPIEVGPLRTSLPDSTETTFEAVLTDRSLPVAPPKTAPLTLELLPNPAHHSTTLLLPALPLSATFTLSDALNRRVRSVAMPPSVLGQRYPLDLSGLPPGLYTGQLTVAGSQLTRRLVVE